MNDVLINIIAIIDIIDIIAAISLLQSVRQLPCCCPTYAQRQFHTLAELTENGLEEGNNNTAVNLMHGVAHIHQVDAKMWNQPERVEE